MRPERFEELQRFAFKTIYSEPEEGNFHSRLIGQMIEKFVAHFQLQPLSFIADLGCGQGQFMDEMKERGFSNLRGITLSDDDFEASSAKGHRVVKGDFSDLPFENNIVDLLWCRHCLEHSPFPYFSLLEFNRVLRINGFLYVEVPAPDNDRIHENNSNHFSILGKTMWLSLFERSGFRCEDGESIRFNLPQANGKDFYKEHYYVFILRKVKNVLLESPSISGAH